MQKDKEKKQGEKKMFNAKYTVRNGCLREITAKFRFTDETAPNERSNVRKRLKELQINDFTNIPLEGGSNSVETSSYDCEKFRVLISHNNRRYNLLNEPGFNMLIQNKQRIHIEEMTRLVDLNALEKYVRTGERR